MTDLKKVRGIVFDLDGTLLDTLADLAHSANKALNEFGYAGHELPAYRYYVGHGIEELIRRALPGDRRSETEVKRVLARFQEIYTRTWNVDSRPYSGIETMLDRLEALGIPMAVYTNKPQHLAQECVDEFFSRWHLKPVLGQRAGIPVKPDPNGIETILQGWNMDAADVIMMGDSGVDMDTARNAGCLAVGVSWGFRDEAELKRSGAQVMLQTAKELFDHFEFV